MGQSASIFLTLFDIFDISLFDVFTSIYHIQHMCMYHFMLLTVLVTIHWLVSDFLNYSPGLAIYILAEEFEK